MVLLIFANFQWKSKKITWKRQQPKNTPNNDETLAHRPFSTPSSSFSVSPFPPLSRCLFSVLSLSIIFAKFHVFSRRTKQFPYISKLWYQNLLKIISENKYINSSYKTWRSSEILSAYKFSVSLGKVAFHPYNISLINSMSCRMILFSRWYSLNSPFLTLLYFHAKQNN